MELWGCSYLLHDTVPTCLVGVLGSSTGRGGTGAVSLSFHQEPGVFMVTRNEAKCELTIKWDVALTFVALLQILVLQNRLLRDNAPHVGAISKETRVFDVHGGWRMAPIACSWDTATTDVECRPVPEGKLDEFELVMGEEAAVALGMALAERIALNGTSRARAGGM